MSDQDQHMQSMHAQHEHQMQQLQQQQQQQLQAHHPHHQQANAALSAYETMYPAAAAAVTAAGLRPLLSQNAVQLAAAAASSSSIPGLVPPSEPVPEIRSHPAVRMFENWHKSHPHYGSSFQPLSHLPIGTLLVIIGDWVVNVQKTHGGTYSADTLYVYLSSIQRHIRVTHRLPSFNLLDSDTVKVAMEKKFGPDAMANLLNRGQAAADRVRNMEKAHNNKRKREEKASSEMNVASASPSSWFGLPKPGLNGQLFGLPSGDLLAFKPPKPSHSHRSFHTEQRLLSARQDPSTPEGLLRCLLWIMLTHIPSMSKTACWNLTMNQFQVLTTPHNPEEKKDGQDHSMALRYLQYQPARKRDSNSFRSDQAQPIVMYAQPSMLHCCPVFLFTEFQKHRPPHATGKSEHGGGEDASHLWLLTKKTIDIVGEHAGQWYSNRRIGQGTMEKLISVVKNSRNQPAAGGDALAERALQLAVEEAVSEEDEHDDDDDEHSRAHDTGFDGHGDEDEEDVHVAKRPRAKRESAAAAQASIAFGNFAGLGSQQPPSVYPWQKVRSKKESPQQRLAKSISLVNRTNAALLPPTAAAFPFNISQMLPAMAANGAAAAAAGGLAAGVPSLPLPTGMNPTELRAYVGHFGDNLRQMKIGLEAMERSHEELKNYLATLNAQEAAANGAVAQPMQMDQANQ